MGCIHHSQASLRIFGDDLDPDTISSLLHCEPTKAQRKGDLIRYASGRERTIACGSWLLAAQRAEPEALDDQVKWLMSQVSDDLGIWQDLTASYDVDIFCGLFMQSGNDGIWISPMTMLELGKRGIGIGLDIYGADDEDHSDG